MQIIIWASILLPNSRKFIYLEISILKYVLNSFGNAGNMKPDILFAKLLKKTMRLGSAKVKYY